VQAQTRLRISETKTGQPTTPAQQAAADRRRGAPLRCLWVSSLTVKLEKVL